jgi:potassium-transporting ATPase KdpC subunit
VLRHLRTSVLLLVALSTLTGALYPALVTGIAAILFPQRARGSLIERGGEVLGSELIGQPFEGPRYFWGRPSATAPFPYNAAASRASNLGPSNPALAGAVRQRIEALRAADPGNTAPVPIDLVTASASGLDPDISIAAAQYQAARVARARGLPVAAVRALIGRATTPRQLGVLGEPRVDVLELNLALDGEGFALPR